MIRLGVPADLVAVREIFRHASLSNAGDRAALLAHPEHLLLGPTGLDEGRTYVSEDDGHIVGFATWVAVGDMIELEDLFVHPQHLRRGIATGLVERVAEVVRAGGAARIEVTANPHARSFYNAAGFTTCGVAETEFGQGSRMVRKLR